MSVRFDTTGRVGVITLSRPEARNCIDPETARRIEEILDRLEADREIYAAVFAAEGPVFCAGTDLGLVTSGRSWETSTDRGDFAGFTGRALTKPVIAACDGPAVAGGAEIALACDMIVASESAWFSFPEVGLGLLAGGGGVVRLPRVLPRNIAVELLLSGARLSAQRAHELGMVNRLTAPGEATAAAVELASEIAGGGAAAIHQTLRLLRETRDRGDAEGLEASRLARLELESSADFEEGARAFLEKRAPVWTERYPAPLETPHDAILDDGRTRDEGEG